MALNTFYLLCYHFSLPSRFRYAFSLCNTLSLLIVLLPKDEKQYDSKGNHVNRNRQMHKLNPYLCLLINHEAVIKYINPLMC